MEEIKCPCGTTYTPKDEYAKRRHESSKSHLLLTENQTPAAEPDEAFSDLDLDEPVAKVKAKPKAKVTPKVVNVGDHKICRVCGKDKPLTEYRKKSTRPDGRDTLCAACSKDWLVAHRAKKAATS